MNKAEINVQDFEPPSWCNTASLFAKKVLKELKKDNWELSVIFCGKKTIKKLNSQYRNKNEATDILSFNLGETVKKGKKNMFLAGDIFICLPVMRENAKYFKIPENEELQRLIIHGILHLHGMDHKSNDFTEEPMLKLQENLLLRLKKNIILGDNK